MNQSDPSFLLKRNKQKILKSISELIDENCFILGPRVEQFEKSWSKYCGTKHAVGCASGTDAIELILRALGDTKGKYAVTPSHTAVATVSAVIRSGMTPIFADIEDSSYNLCPDSLERCLEDATISGRKVGAVITVHLYGQPCNIESILDITNKYRVPLIEDCSQAHGASISNVKVGAFGLAGAFSLYPTKNLGAAGDAGIITSNNDILAEKIRYIRQYGWIERGISSIHGINSRLDPIQAIILSEQLKVLDDINEHRIALAKTYTRTLHDLDSLSVPLMANSKKHVFHQYVIRLRKPEIDVAELRRWMKQKNIETSIHYPCPVHKMPAFCNVDQYPCDPEGLIVTNSIINRILSLPMGAHISLTEAEQIALEVVGYVTDKTDS